MKKHLRAWNMKTEKINKGNFQNGELIAFAGSIRACHGCDKNVRLIELKPCLHFKAALVVSDRLVYRLAIKHSTCCTCLRSKAGTCSASVVASEGFRIFPSKEKQKRTIFFNTYGNYLIGNFQFKATKLSLKPQFQTLLVIETKCKISIESGLFSWFDLIKLLEREWYAWVRLTHSIYYLKSKTSWSKASVLLVCGFTVNKYLPSRQKLNNHRGQWNWQIRWDKMNDSAWSTQKMIIKSFLIKLSETENSSSIFGVPNSTFYWSQS